MPAKIAIHGAAGRMGRRLIALGYDDSTIELVGALENAGNDYQGSDAGDVAGIGTIGIPILSELQEEADAIIDFSVPVAVDSIVALARERKVGLVVATTGLESTTEDRVRDATNDIPVVWAPNMSLAVNLTMKLSAIAAQALADHASGVDVEILERHHRYKEDSPSGTALGFGKVIAENMPQLTAETHGREGRPGVRTRNEIGYHAIRAGDDPGQHTIVFGMLGETIELTVKATNRDCYALGALAAAKFVAQQPPGLYSMFDVLQI